MNKELALTKINKGIFQNIITFVKSRFFNINKNVNDTKKNIKINNSLDDLECLKNIIDKKISIKELDIEQKKRLILLCNERKNKINMKIEQTDMKIKKVENMIAEVEKLNQKVI